MDIQSLNPPIDLITNFQSLQTDVQEDTSGEKTRRLVTYLKEAETKSIAMKLHTLDYEEKEFARLLHEAFGASSRIVLAAWQKAHGAELDV